MSNGIKYTMKQHFRDVMIEQLYKYSFEQARLKLSAILFKNNQLTGNRHAYVHYQGEFYSADAFYNKKSSRQVLAEELHAEMNEYIEMKKQLDWEKAYCLSTITSLLTASHNPHNYKLLFPEKVIAPVIGLIDQQDPGKPTIKPEKVEELKTRHKDGIFKMKRRLMLDMLT